MAVRRVLAGRYRLEQRLGGGGMSVVWRAYDEVLGRRVAVKVVSPRHANEALARERIRTEAAAVARLNHPHLTKLLDHSVSGSTPYLVMELLEGQTLARRMRAGPLPVRAALEICAQVADALAAAHASGVVHRDIKPGNVMLTPDGATILDFGIAAFVDLADQPAGDLADQPAGPPESVPEDRIWGTAAYVAPERLTQRRALPASDVYALGVLLYRALTGHRPWPAVGRAEILAAHVTLEPAPLPADAGVPPRVAALCHRCLAKDPRARPTARQVAAVLAPAAVQVARQAPPVPAYPAPARPAPAYPAPVARRPARAGTGGTRRFQRRHAATASGRMRRAMKAGSATLAAAMVMAVSFCAVTDRTRQPVAPEAAPPPILPGDSPPPDREPGTRPPDAGRKPPDRNEHPDSAPAMRDTSGRAGGQRGSDSVPVGRRPATGARTSPPPSAKPSPPASSPTPEPTPPPTSPAPSPPERTDPITEVLRTLDSLTDALTGRCVGGTASPASRDPLLGLLLGGNNSGSARDGGPRSAAGRQSDCLL